MVRKASQKRDAVLDILKHTTTHPTADWIFSELQKKYPNVGIATVYRNLKILLEQQLIKKVDVGDGIDHYDGNVDVVHDHTYCIKCGAIGDIKQITGDAIEQFAGENFSAESYSLILFGKCKNCLQEEALGI